MILFFISLIICIILHEFSHLLIAKLVKCKVEVFSIGFGKPIYTFEIGETRYNITPFLLGGYCKLKGEKELSNDKDAFCNLSYLRKFLLICAGCFSNILIGAIILFLGNIYHNYSFFYFGYLSLWLGISNLLPIPALDGSYLFLVWLEKFYGKEKGYLLLNKIVTIGFVIIMILNILSIPLLIYLLIIGVY